MAVLVELCGIVLEERLAETVDTPQRRAQIVRKRVAEGLELTISGLGGLLRAPQTYLVIVLGPVFFFLLQKSLQAGRLVASQPALTLANPLVSVAFGFAVFNEHLRAGAWLILALFGAGLIIACTVLLARSPLLHSSGSNESPRTTAASRPVLASNSPLTQKTSRNR